MGDILKDEWELWLFSNKKQGDELLDWEFKENLIEFTEISL